MFYSFPCFPYTIIYLLIDYRNKCNLIYDNRIILIYLWAPGFTLVYFIGSTADSVCKTGSVILYQKSKILWKSQNSAFSRCYVPNIMVRWSSTKRSVADHS